jgi:hypothetical protein
MTINWQLVRNNIRPFETKVPFGQCDAFRNFALEAGVDLKVVGGGITEFQGDAHWKELHNKVKSE